MTMATNYGTKTRILLSGSAGKLFGREHIHELSTGDTREAVKAIDVNHPGFAKYLADAKRKGLEFAVFRNRKNIGEKELKLGGAQEIRIVPVIAGSKRAGLFQTVLGVVLIAMSSVTNGATLAPGIALAAGGVIQMLSPQATGLKQSPPLRTLRLMHSAAPRTPRPAATRSRSASVNAGGAG
jgi:predicted phage tail protein